MSDPIRFGEVFDIPPVPKHLRDVESDWVPGVYTRRPAHLCVHCLREGRDELAALVDSWPTALCASHASRFNEARKELADAANMGGGKVDRDVWLEIMKRHIPPRPRVETRQTSDEQEP